VQIARVRDARSAQALAGEQQLAVRGVEEVGNGGGELALEDAAQERAQEWLDEPGEEGEFALPQCVGQLVDLDADAAQREDLFELVLADFDV